MAGGALTAGVINYLKEEITKQKPREMTWPEFLHMGGEDKAYTLFSKAATAGYAGILSELGLYATQFYHGEMPQGFNSPSFILEDNIAQRVGQYLTAFRNGETDINGLGTLGLQLLKDQVQVARQIMRPEDRGLREERIAKRLGYLPNEEPPSGESSKANPFSANAAYLKGDDKAAARIIQSKIARGRPINEPTSEIKTGYALLPSGELGTYYDLIRKMQGEKAAEDAYGRDITNTQKKYDTFSSALAR
jgi:hypothetical protein